MRLSDLHGFLNHFSIALIILGVLIEYYTFLRSQEDASSPGWIILRAGVMFMVLSLLTGLISEGKVFMDSAARPISNYHKLTSTIAFAIVTGSVLLRMLSRESFIAPKGAALRGAYLTLLTVGLMMTCASIYFGMELVYEHGVSVTPYEHLLESLPATAVPQSQTPALQTPTPQSTTPQSPANQNPSSSGSVDTASH